MVEGGRSRDVALQGSRSLSLADGSSDFLSRGGDHLKEVKHFDVPYKTLLCAYIAN